MFITVTARILMDKNRYESMAIEPKDEDFEWKKISFRVDEIYSFSEHTSKKTTVNFYDESSILIAESHENFLKRMEEAYKNAFEEPTKDTYEA